MFDDRIEIVSPGGLPKGLSANEYLNGGISIPRNPILCNVLMRLHMIERFGTGIRRINEVYEQSVKKPQYKVMENTIKMILPVMNGVLNLSEDERIILELLRNTNMKSSDIISATGFGKTKVVYLLNNLVENGFVIKRGQGRATVYTVINT